MALGGPDWGQNYWGGSNGFFPWLKRGRQCAMPPPKNYTKPKAHH